MTIERKVKQAAARYSAIITNAGTRVEALVDGDLVALKVPGSRGIVRVPIEEWDSFVELMNGISDAVGEKRQIEEAAIALPWERTETGPRLQPPVWSGGTEATQAPQAVVVRDAATGLPVQAAPYGPVDPDDAIVPDPIPTAPHGGPRVSA